MSNRNTAIDAMRFIFILILCPFHCPAVNPFPNGYIAVEFFFILAGFFIYLSYRKHNDIGTIDFTLKKAKRFFWPLIISLLLLVLIDRKKYIYPHDLTPDGIVSQYFAHIPEFLFCQGLHLIDVDSYINVALWFVSILWRTRQTLWRAVQMLTQKLCCQTIHDCPKVVPLHYESE